MSTNHNRIRVADLETNQPNKILKTNQNGELEFQNAENLSVELASDLETQINTAVPEDAKLVSRSKLFNWWNWIKSQTQTISGDWSFIKGIKFNRQIGEYNYQTDVNYDGLGVQINSSNGLARTQYERGAIRYSVKNFSTFFSFLAPTQNNTITVPDKSGTIAFTYDFITTATGSANKAPLIIPIGTLTTVPQNGAIERDQNGLLWETHGNIRSQIVTTNYINNNYSSDTYIPTLDNTLNIIGTTLLNANYIKVGNFVIVTVALTVTPKNLGEDTEIGISLPFNRTSSNLLLCGTVTGATSYTNFSAQAFVANSSKAIIKYKANNSGLANIVANFSYSIN